MARNIVAALGLVLVLASAPGAREESVLRAELYFPGPDGGLAKEMRTLPEYSGERELVKVLFEALAWGPEDKSLFPALPAGAELRSLFILPGGLVVLDMEGEPLRSHPTGGLKELGTLRSLVFTIIKNVPGAQRIKILVDGREAETLSGHINIEAPLAPEDLSSGLQP